MKRIGLLIGVERYRDPRIAPLQFAAADAIALAERLRATCGFDRTVVLSDHGGDAEPDLVNITTTLSELAGELREDDLFLFFFSGHGIEVDGHGYLLTRDSPQDYPEHCSLSLELLRKSFSRLSAGTRIVLVDACRNAPDLAKGDAANVMSDTISRDILSMTRGAPGLPVMHAMLTACRTGQRAYEWPKKRHGVFTHYLLDGLHGSTWENDELEFRKLAEFTTREVRHWSMNTRGPAQVQEPWYEETGGAKPIVLARRPRQTNFGRGSPASTQPRAAIVDEPQITVPVDDGPSPHLSDRDVRSELRGQIASIQNEIDVIEKGIYPALDKLQRTETDAESRLKALRSESRADSLKVPKAIRDKIRDLIATNPSVSAPQLCSLAPTVTIERLLPIVRRMALMQELTAVRDGARNKYGSTRDSLLQERRERLIELSARLADLENTEFQQIVHEFFRSIGTYDGLPIREWVKLEPELSKHNFSWDAATQLQLAQKLSGSWPDQLAWETASNYGRLEAFAEYLCSYPRGKYVQRACERITTTLETIVTQEPNLQHVSTASERIRGFVRKTEAGLADKKGMTKGVHKLPELIQSLRDDEAWCAAEAEGGLEAYERDLADWPHGDHGPVARERVGTIRDDEAWTTASVAHSEEGYEAYLRAEPKGGHRKEASASVSQIRDEQAWAAAVAVNTQGGYGVYLQRWKKGLHVKEAKRRLDAIADDAAWERAQSNQSAVALSDYLKAFSSGRYASEAQAALKRLDAGAWQIAHQEHTMAALSEYVSCWPEGMHAEEARRELVALDEDAWRKAKAEDSEDSLRAYLKDWTGCWASSCSTRMY